MLHVILWSNCSNGGSLNKFALHQEKKLHLHLRGDTHSNLIPNIKYKSYPHSYEYYRTSSEKKAWKKFRPIQDLNPWPLQYQCSALPTELTSQLGASIAEVMVQISYKPEFYFRPYFTSSSVVFITVRIASIFVSSTTVHIHYFHIITIMY